MDSQRAPARRPGPGSRVMIWIRSASGIISALSLMVGLFGLRISQLRFLFPYVAAIAVAGGCYWVFAARKADGSPSFHIVVRRSSLAFGILAALWGTALASWVVYVNLLQPAFAQKEATAAFEQYNNDLANFSAGEPDPITGKASSGGSFKSVLTSLNRIAMLKSTPTAPAAPLERELNARAPAGFLVDVTPISSQSFVGNILRIRRNVDQLTVPQGKDSAAKGCFFPGLQYCFFKRRSFGETLSVGQQDANTFFASIAPKYRGPFEPERQIVLTPNDFLSKDLPSWLSATPYVAWFSVATIQDWRKGFALTLLGNTSTLGGKLRSNYAYVVKVNSVTGGKSPELFPVESWRSTTSWTAMRISGDKDYDSKGYNKQLAKLFGGCVTCYNLNDSFEVTWDEGLGKYGVTDLGISRNPLTLVLKMELSALAKKKPDSSWAISEDTWSKLSNDLRMCKIDNVETENRSSKISFECPSGGEGPSTLTLSQSVDGQWTFAGLAIGSN